MIAPQLSLSLLWDELGCGAIRHPEIPRYCRNGAITHPTTRSTAAKEYRYIMNKIVTLFLLLFVTLVACKDPCPAPVIVVVDAPGAAQEEEPALYFLDDEHYTFFVLEEPVPEGSHLEVTCSDEEDPEVAEFVDGYAVTNCHDIFEFTMEVVADAA